MVPAIGTGKTSSTACHPAGCHRGFQLIPRKRLAKPDNIRAEQPAARLTPRHGMGVIAPHFGKSMALRTSHALDVAVQFKDISTAGHTVQSVHVLGDQAKIGNALFQVHEGVMPRVWPHAFDGFAPPGVPVPDEFGVAGKRLRRGKILRLILRPQAALRITEGAETAFLRDSSPGQRDQFQAGARGGLPSPAEEGDQFGGKRHGETDRHMIKDIVRS